MFLQYLNYKENKNKKITQFLYNSIVKRVLFVISENKIYIKSDFNSSFEITSIYIISLLYALKNKNNKESKILSQNLVNIFFKDLDYSLRVLGISDMSVGKYVKKYVKKFYWRLDNLELIFKESNNEKFDDFIEKLNILNKIKKPLNLKFFSFLDMELLIKKIIKSKIKSYNLYLLFI